MLHRKNSKYRYLILALFLPGFAFSVYRTCQAEFVPIKEYQRARLELANITPPVGDRLEDHYSSYQNYRTFSRSSYHSAQSKEWISSFFTHQLESTGWLTKGDGLDGKYFCKNGLRVYLSYAATRETRYSLGFMLDRDKSSVRHNACQSTVERSP